MKHRRGWGVALVILAVLVIGGGLVLRFVVYPSQLHFPADVDETRAYEGELAVMLDPAALAAGDLANLFLRDVPVTLERHVATLEVGGDDGALVLEEAAMEGPAGPIMATEDVYAIDRTTMESIENFSEDTRVIAREGLVIGFPIGTEQQDYVGWNGDTFETVTLAYVGEESRGGIDTYRFEAADGPGVIVDPALLATLPPTLPTTLIGQLAVATGASGDQVAQLGQLLQGLEEVPITYTYAFEKTYWVEPTTGVLIDIDVFETRAAALTAPDGSLVPLAEIQQLSYVTTAASVQDAVDDANSAISTMRIYGFYLPLIAIGLGIVAGGFGIWLMLRRRDEIPVVAEKAERETLGV